MSKKFRYFSLIMMLIVFVSIGAVCAADVNDSNTSTNISDSSVQNVTNIAVPNSVDLNNSTSVSDLNSSSNLESDDSGLKVNYTTSIDNTKNSITEDSDIKTDVLNKSSVNTVVNNQTNKNSNANTTVNNNSLIKSTNTTVNKISKLKVSSLSLKTTSTPTSFSISQIVSAARTVRAYYALYGKLPSTVTVGSVNLSLSQFLYYESKAIDQLNSGSTANIAIISNNLNEPSSPNRGDSVNGNLYKAGYVDSATRTYKFILNYNQGPNYSTTTVGRVSYNRLIEAFAAVLDYYGTNKQLPSYINVKYNSKTTTPADINTVNSFSINQIISAAKVVRNYYKTNGKLPSTVTVGSVKLSLAQFLYYESVAISQLNSGNTANIAIVNNTLNEPSSPNRGDSVNGNLTKSGYVDSATRTYKFILNYNQGPNYSTTTIGRVSYNRLIEAFSAVLEYYGTNKQLPNYVYVKYNAITNTPAGISSNSTNSSTSNNTKPSNNANSSTNISVINKTNEFTISQITSAAKVVRAYYLANGKLPSTVTVGSTKLSLAQFLYYESVAISQLNSGNTKNIAIVNKTFNEPSSPNSGDSINGNLTKSAYADSATRTYKFILNYNQGPNYSTTTLGRVSYNKLIETFSNVLEYYDSHKTLPSNVLVNTNFTGNYTYFVVSSSGTYVNGSKFVVVLKDAFDNTVANKKVVFTLNGKEYTGTTDAKGVVYITIPVLNNGNYNVSYKYTDTNNRLSSSNSTTIKVVKNVTTISGSDLTTTNKSNEKFSITLKDAFGNLIANQKVQFRISGSNIVYEATTNAKGVASLAINLPAGNYTITYTFGGNSNYPKSTGSSKIFVTNAAVNSNSFTINQIISAAKTVKAYYATNKQLPSTVTVGSVKLSLAQFLYYESRAISQLNAGDLSNIDIINNTLNEPSSPNSGDSVNNDLSKDGYVDSATRTYKFILNYNQGPNYSTTTIGRVSYNALIEAFSRVLADYGDNKQLPSSISIDTTSSNSYSGTDHAASNSEITALALKITGNLTSDYDKAVALFNWVRDNIEYNYYSNSLQGAALTLTRGSGNCCDQSNLLVSMCRVVGLTVRYVHGYCHFSDGWYGHVWTEIYVNGNWYSADPVSTRNTFGAINNWNTETATYFNRYTYLPF
ncbi:transglutaminase domain-containing protein [Methanobrevibacter wolinii]|uniref:transglutaminase domain-containing protein n=1 Tax=Methanobrevibacter wolinii TaxID=190977 RepID=UPI0006935821|nr:transglutaminase domain-containing protein [Methanobrevibacter wolinii]